MQNDSANGRLRAHQQNRGTFHSPFRIRPQYSPDKGKKTTDERAYHHPSRVRSFSRHNDEPQYRNSHLPEGGYSDDNAHSLQEDSRENNVHCHQDRSSKNRAHSSPEDSDSNPEYFFTDCGPPIDSEDEEYAERYYAWMRYANATGYHENQTECSDSRNSPQKAAHANPLDHHVEPLGANSEPTAVLTHNSPTVSPTARQRVTDRQVTANRHPKVLTSVGKERLVVASRGSMTPALMPTSTVVAYFLGQGLPNWPFLSETAGRRRSV